MVFLRGIKTVPSQKLQFWQESAINKKALTLFIMMTFGALDPAFIQRLILCKNEKQAKYICKFTGIISLPFFCIMGMFGLVTFTLNPNIDPQYTLPFLIDQTLPVFLKGIAIASLLAILMSSIDASIHVSGLSLVQDVIIPATNLKLPEDKQLKLVRIVTLFSGAVSACIAIYFKNILNIMIFAFSFWGPTVLVPLIFALYGTTFTSSQFIRGISLGFTSVLIWNSFLKFHTNLDGFIPGIIINTAYFLWIKRKRPNLQKEPQKGY